MAATPLIHPSLMASLRNCFPSSCDIQAATSSRDSFGGDSQTWANVSGLTSLASMIVPASLGRPERQEQRQVNMTVKTVTHIISLQGSYPSITTALRAVVSSINYNILSAEQDSQGVTTRLLVELVTE
jgi:hypothetical protein